MQTTKPELIAEYRQRGWWSDTRITDLFDAAVRSEPTRLAVVDAHNRPLLTGAPALRLADNCVVQGLESDAKRVETARAAGLAF